VKYSVVLVPEADGSFTVRVPALPGVVAQGRTRQEAIDMSREAIATHLETLLAEGESLAGEGGVLIVPEVTDGRS